jgi:transcriptional regulator with XRE-family HTH domain
VTDGDVPVRDAGDLLRRARRIGDLSQRELAARAQVSARVVARIESGETTAPRLNTLLSLVGAAGCHLALRPGLPGDVAEPGPAATDRAGRHFPAHLDVRPVDRFGTWWGDWPFLSTRVEKIWHRAPRQRPDNTFDLARWRRPRPGARNLSPQAEANDGVTSRASTIAPRSILEFVIVDSLEFWVCGGRQEVYSRRGQIPNRF